MKDNLKAQILQPDGTYEKVDKRGKELFCAQDAFCQEAMEAGMKKEKVQDTRRFVPKTHVEE